MSRKLQGWRYAGFLGLIVGSIGAATYPIIIHPMLYPEGYQKVQEITRKNIRQEDIQPGNMKVWTDPFDRTKE